MGCFVHCMLYTGQCPPQGTSLQVSLRPSLAPSLAHRHRTVAPSLPRSLSPQLASSLPSVPSSLVPSSTLPSFTPARSRHHIISRSFPPSLPPSLPPSHPHSPTSPCSLPLLSYNIVLVVACYLLQSIPHAR